ncbi:hypothetical protein F4677DRAFT_165451 [Hypoxylon crocopeplum]|nr:hypothetical protein F4677DRAFT_165451 [Hypoxylon crocopeplum]
MASAVDNAILRNGSSPELARYFQQLLLHTHWKQISDHIFASVDSGAVPPTVVSVFLSVCKEPGAVTDALRQRVSHYARLAAIHHFKKQSRSDSFFDIWNAVGGTEGLLALMSQISVDEVHSLCRRLGETNVTKGPVQARQQCMSELFEALHNTDGENRNVPRNPDVRPLGSYYDLIIPACTGDTIFETISEARRPRKIASQARAEPYQRAFLTAICPGKQVGKKITPYKFVLDGSNVNFSLDVLQWLSVNPTSLGTNADNVMADLILPLARRLGNQRAHVNLQIRFYDLIIRCINAKPSIVNMLQHKIISYAIQAWNRAPEKREAMKDLLATLISLMPNRYPWTLEAMAGELRRIQYGLRLPLLQLSLQNAKQLMISIDLYSKASNENLRSLIELWPPVMFWRLPSGIALRLFQYIRRAHPDDRFISARGPHSWKVVMDSANYDHEEFGDPDSFSALMHSRHYGINSNDASWLSGTEKVLQERRVKAIHARNAVERADWARSAVLLSIASGSLSLYEDTLLWARRFNRDHLALKVLYADDTICTSAGLDLLCAIPDSTTNPDYLGVMKRNIERANQILMEFLETLSTCRREPAFHLRSMEGILLLPSKVIGRRIVRLSALQKHTGLSYDEIFDSVWEPTITMLLDVERFGLEQEHSKFKANTLNGPLKKEAIAGVHTRHIAKFLDKLGESRDKLWKEYRLQTYPAVTILQASWPRGLPIQYIAPPEFYPTMRSSHAPFIRRRRKYVRNTRTCSPAMSFKNMPYLELRARSIVFASGEDVLAALPDDKEVSEAIGPFVDEYSVALRIFALAVDKGPERDGRILQAWNHALTELTGNRMSAEEAVWYWKKVFDSDPDHKLPEAAMAAFKIADIALPAQDEFGNPVEWNPSLKYLSTAPASTVKHEPRQLPKTILDCMLTRHSAFSGPRICDIHAPFDPQPTSTSASEVKTSVFYFYASLATIPPSTKDALVAVTMASLNAKYGSDSSFLMQPFPTLDDARFPALYLDEEFLEGIGVGFSHAPLLFTRLSASVPTQLLRSLAESLLTRLETNGDNADALKATIELIKRLSLGDHPSAACDLIREVVLNSQDYSSWFRHILNEKFLRRLSASEAKAFFYDFSMAINDKLRRQQREIASSETASKEPSPPLVKVTTVKLVAQLLREAKYVDQKFACEILVSLLKGATHPDIRIEVVEGLLSIKSETAKQELLQSSIVDIIEEHVVPIAASINERRPPTDADWLKAERREGPLPDVYESRGMHRLPPILNLLVDAIPTAFTENDEAGSRRYEMWMRRVIVPILELSSVNHQRWTSLFLKHNGFIPPVGGLPAVPVIPRLLPNLFENHAQFLPSSTFRAIKDLVLINITPPESIVTINNAIETNSELLQSNAGKHWLFVWNATKDPLSLGVYQSTGLLLDKSMNASSEERGGATINALRRFMADVAETYITKSDISGYNEFIECFARRISSPQTWSFFHLNCMPLLESFIAQLNSLRTVEWQHNPNRHPPTLPDTFHIKVQILKGKHSYRSSGALLTVGVRDFARDVTSLIQELTNDGTPYHDKWPVLKLAATRQFYSDCFIPLALEFGSLLRTETRNLSLVDHLRVELAGDFISQAKYPEDVVLANKLDELLESWKNSYDENVRMRADPLIVTVSKNRNKNRGHHDRNAI